MKLTPEEIAAHAALSEHNLAFVEAAAADPALRRRSSFAEYDLRTMMRHYPLQPWPTLVGREALDELTGVARAIHRLCRDVPRRVFGFDLARIADYYGLEPAFAERTLGDPEGIERAPSRGDYIWSADGLKLLEFNCGNALGGWQMPMVSDLFAGNRLVAGFLARRGLSVHHRNTVRLILEHMVGEAVRTGVAADGEANVVFTVFPSDPGSDYAREIEPYLEELLASFSPPEYYDAELAAALTAFPGLERGRVINTSYGALEVRDGAVYLGDRRIHVIGDQVDFPTREIFRCYREGGVQLFSGPISMILGDKRSLALLSRAADEGDGPWTAEERETIRRHLPWTRRVGPGRERRHGEEAALPDLLTADREGLVLKRGNAFGGYAVHVGRSTAPADWQRAVARALADGDWIVQDYVATRPYLYQNGDDEVCRHLVIWGLYMFGESYGGALLRLQPLEGDAIVNIHRGASASVLLEIE